MIGQIRRNKLVIGYIGRLELHRRGWWGNCVFSRHSSVQIKSRGSHRILVVIAAARAGLPVVPLDPVPRHLLQPLLGVTRQLRGRGRPLGRNVDHGGGVELGRGNLDNFGLLGSCSGQIKSDSGFGDWPRVPGELDIVVMSKPWSGLAS